MSWWRWEFFRCLLSEANTRKVLTLPVVCKSPRLCSLATRWKSLLSVAMAATSTSNPRGPSFSTSGLKTFFYTVLACIVYLCLLCRKIYRLPEMVHVCWLRNGNFFLFFITAHAYSHQQKFSLRAGLSTWGLKTKSLAKHKKAYPVCVYYTHKKMLLAWSCLQWWLSLESSTIPLVRAFIQKSWYFQALCFLLLSWKACLSAGRGWITRREQNLEVHREPRCRWAGAEVVPCRQQHQVSSVPQPANPDLLVPQRSLAPNAKSAAFLHKSDSRATQKGCIHLWVLPCKKWMCPFGCMLWLWTYLGSTC